MQRCDTGHYRLRFIGTATAVIVGAIAIGLIPRCDDVQTRAMAAEQHEQLRRECIDSKQSILTAFDELAEVVRAALARKDDHAPRRRRD